MKVPKADCFESGGHFNDLGCLSKWDGAPVGLHADVVQKTTHSQRERTLSNDAQGSCDYGSIATSVRPEVMS
jgi:hypothetical protein